MTRVRTVYHRSERSKKTLTEGVKVNNVKIQEATLAPGLSKIFELALFIYCLLMLE